MNDPIAWRRSELERRRDRHLARAVRAADLGIEIDRRDIAEIRQCQSELEVLALVETALNVSRFDT